MSNWVDTIENSGLPTWVRESPSMFAYTQVLTGHAIGLSLIVGLNWVIALPLLGFVPAMPLTALRTLVAPMYVGIAINFISGSMLLAAALQDNLKSRYFLLKMIFIVLAIVNLEYTRRRVFRHAALQHNQVPRDGRRAAWLALSLWMLVICGGRLIMYDDALRYSLGME